MEQTEVLKELAPPQEGMLQVVFYKSLVAPQYS